VDVTARSGDDRSVKGSSVTELVTLAAAAAVLSLAGCGDTEERATTTPAARRAASPPSPLSIDRAELVAHTTYATDRFRPALRFSVGPGSWMVENRESSTDFSIAIDMPRTLGATIGWHRVTRVYDPVEGGEIPADLVPLDGDFVGWLTHHPRLRTSRPVHVTVAGLAATQVDVASTSEPARVPHDCDKAGPRCVPLFYDGQDTLTYARGDKGRFIVLDLPAGGQLVIEEFASPGTRFQRVLTALAPTLDSLTLAR
jgi:hypothetical protein